MLQVEKTIVTEQKQLFNDWRRAWQPIPVFFPRESPRTGEPSPWGHKESDMTAEYTHHSYLMIGT